MTGLLMIFLHFRTDCAGKTYCVQTGCEEAGIAIRMVARQARGTSHESRPLRPLSETQIRGKIIYNTEDKPPEDWNFLVACPVSYGKPVTEWSSCITELRIANDLEETNLSHVPVAPLFTKHFT